MIHTDRVDSGWQAQINEYFKAIERTALTDTTNLKNFKFGVGSKKSYKTATIGFLQDDICLELGLHVVLFDAFLLLELSHMGRFRNLVYNLNNVRTDCTSE